MTRHPAMILLAMYWVLVVPSSGENSAQAPIQWQRVGLFNSAKGCEAVRGELIAAARRPFGDPWMVPSDTVPIEQQTSWADSLCLPATIPEDTTDFKPHGRGSGARGFLWDLFDSQGMWLHRQHPVGTGGICLVRLNMVDPRHRDRDVPIVYVLD